LFRATLQRLDLATEIYHVREPELPLAMSPDEMKRLPTVASLKARIMLSLGYEQLPTAQA
jgi:integrase/recombinase XerD